MIRVLIVDDQEMIRAGLRVIIDAHPDLQVVAESGDALAAIRLLSDAEVDVVLMDIRMPGTDGISATQLITDDLGLSDVKVLILTTFEADDHVLAALRAGASGFLGKGVEPAELLDGIRVVAAGDALLSPRATRGLIDRYLAQPSNGAVEAVDPSLDVLTDREREVVALVAHGLSNDQIAARLFVSPLTAKTHVNRSMTKLGVRDRAQLVVIAYQTGLVRAGDE